MHASTSILAILLVSFTMAPHLTAQVRFAAKNGSHLDGQLPGSPLRASDFAGGDVDGDGDVDLVVATEGWCRLYLNDGSGVFPTFRELPARPCRRVALVDIDGDKDLDVLLAPGTNAPYRIRGQAVLLLNDGSGNFTDKSVNLPRTRMLVIELAVVDIDKDGDPDAVFFRDDLGSDTLSVWTNDGAGKFIDRTATAIANKAMGPTRWGGVADLDRDGAPDLVMTLAISGARLFRNDGKGKFTSVKAWTGPKVIRAVADFDGDGFIDLLGDTRVCRNDKTGSSFSSIATLPSLATAVRVSVADFNGDKRLDIVGTDVRARPFLLLDTGKATYALASWFEPHARVDRTVDQPNGTHRVLDIDGDGDMDLLTGGVEGRGHSSTTVGIPPKVYVNAGGTRLLDTTRRAFPYVQAGVAAVATGDVDGDGDIDLYLSYHGRYKWSGKSEAIWLQDDRGQFLEGTGLSSTFGISAAAAFADVDRDGDLDLITGRGWDPVGPPRAARHRLHLNDGKGNFTDVTAARLPVTARGAASALAVGDVDGDGDVDLVIGEQHPTQYASSAGGQNRLFLNDGFGSFTDATARLPRGSDDTMAIRLADMDRDGDLDLLIQNGRFQAPPKGMALRFLENDGKGTFTDVTARRLPTLTRANRLDVVDLEPDGDLDITLAAGSLINNGAGVFKIVARNADRVLTRDFDEDGTGDHVEARRNGYSIAGKAITWGASIGSLDALAVDLDQDRDLDLILYGLGPATTTKWTILPVGVLYNMRRDVRVASLPRLGQPYRIQFRAGVGKRGAIHVIPALAPSLIRPRIEFPGLGLFALDTVNHIVLPIVKPPDADTPAELTFQIPANSSLAGSTIAVQALFVPIRNVAGARLSNAVVHEITR